VKNSFLLLLLLGAMSRVLVLALLAVTSTASAEIVVTDSTEKETLAVIKSVPVNFLTKALSGICTKLQIGVA
jgi:hypothetical protein